MPTCSFLTMPLVRPVTRPYRTNISSPHHHPRHHPSRIARCRRNSARNRSATSRHSINTTPHLPHAVFLSPHPASVFFYTGNSPTSPASVPCTGNGSDLCLRPTQASGGRSPKSQGALRPAAAALSHLTRPHSVVETATEVSTTDLDLLQASLTHSQPCLGVE
jgi:hypothetical protein